MTLELERKRGNTSSKQVPTTKKAPTLRTADKVTLTGDGARHTKKAQVKPPPAVKEIKDAGLFGFKRGFLLSATAGETKSAETPIIKPKQPEMTGVKGIKFEQVQQSMKAQMSILDKQEWLTDDFLEKLEGNSLFRTVATDPEWKTALDLFQKNPSEAIKKYGVRKPQFVKALLEFSGALGAQLEKLADSQDAQAARKKTPVNKKAQPSKVDCVPKIQEL